MKYLVMTTIIFVLVNVNGSEKPAVSVLSGNHITINITNMY